MTSITLGDDLAGYLQKALEIERGFETLSEWEGYVGVKEKELREVLFQLVTDSAQHGRTVETLLDMVRTTADFRGLPLQPRGFNFRAKGEAEIMNEISRTENIMFDLYSDIRDALRNSDMSSLLISPDDASSFMTSLDGLINDEARHISIISKYVRKLDRLR
ncbi:TPA: hypothetical protein HA259_04860 [Thermoplasmata archaeon]|nr:hypothetical protein [Thermoplasmata archaeon]